MSDGPIVDSSESEATKYLKLRSYYTFPIDRPSLVMMLSYVEKGIS